MRHLDVDVIPKSTPDFSGKRRLLTENPASKHHSLRIQTQRRAEFHKTPQSCSPPVSQRDHATKMSSTSVLPLPRQSPSRLCCLALDLIPFTLHPLLLRQPRRAQDRRWLLRDFLQICCFTRIQPFCAQMLRVTRRSHQRSRVDDVDANHQIKSPRYGLPHDPADGRGKDWKGQRRDGEKCCHSS